MRRPWQAKIFTAILCFDVLMPATTKSTTPYFSQNRDETDANQATRAYLRGWADYEDGKPANPRSSHNTVRTAYLRGYGAAKGT